MCLQKIGERALWNDQGFEPGEYPASRSRHKAVPNSRDVNQIFSPVVPNNDGVHSVCAWNVSADDQFLSAVQPVLGPRPAPFSSLVTTIPSLGNDTFQSLAASGTQHVLSRRFKIIRNANSGRLKLQNGFHDLMALDKR
jgi:hypothetical protein